MRQPTIVATPADRAEQIRVNLSRFPSYQQNVTCPGCGYAGPAGFVREVKPLYANCFVLALLFLTLVGIVVVLLLAILGKLRSASQVQCPQCGRLFLNRS